MSIQFQSARPRVQDCLQGILDDWPQRQAVITTNGWSLQEYDRICGIEAPPSVRQLMLRDECNRLMPDSKVWFHFLK